MARSAGRTRKRPGLTRRMARSALQVGMLATAVLVGRRTGGGRDRDGQGGGPGARHETGPAAVAGDGPGRRADRPRQARPRGWKDIARGTLREVKRDQVPLLGAGVAFYGLLSLFPAIIAGISIYVLFADPWTVRYQLDRLAQQLSPETATILDQQIRQVTGAAGGALGLATVVGILTALWSASSGMKALVTGVNLAYEETEGRKFAKLRGLALLLTLGAMLVMGVALALIVGFPAVANSWPMALRWTASILRWVLLAALLMAALTVLYRVAPDRDEPRWTWVSWGSGIATLLWILASIGFSVYANSFGNYNKTYGALAGVIILMFWLYLTAVIVLVGAELNTEVEPQPAAVGS